MLYSPLQVEVPSSAEFVELFQDSAWSERWIPGDQAKAGGEVSAEKGLLDYQLEGEIGLQIKSPAQRHAISAALKKAFRVGEEDFVIQYDLRLHKVIFLNLLWFIYECLCSLLSNWSAVALISS